MNIYKGPWSGIAETESTVITIGTFDGVHLGHQRILDQLKQIASEQGLKSTVVSFDPHPQELLKTKKPDIRILTDIDEKSTILERTGLDSLVIIDFTAELANLSPKTFVEEVIVKRLKAKHVVIGYDHAFGKDREGNRNNVATMANNLHYQVTTVNPVDSNGTIISSTKIRHALYRGDIELANTFLGRPYSITGTVVHGDRRGHILDMPTANINPSHSKKLIPRDGVYAGWAYLDSDSHLAAISVGDRPTFELEDRVLEAHLIDFSGDLYQKTITLEFKQKIRNQIAFTTNQELINQMKSDVKSIKKITVHNHTV